MNAGGSIFWLRRQSGESQTFYIWLLLWLQWCPPDPGLCLTAVGEYPHSPPTLILTQPHSTWLPGWINVKYAKFQIYTFPSLSPQKNKIKNKKRVRAIQVIKTFIKGFLNEKILRDRFQLQFLLAVRHGGLVSFCYVWDFSCPFSLSAPRCRPNIDTE